jgi:gluconokinase
MKTPRSPYEQLGGLVFLGRTLDKIRLRAAGELRADFHELMGKGMDARLMAHLEMDYATFAEFVRTGADDAACVAYVASHGRPQNEVTRLIWNDFASKRGWRDSATETLERFKKESGLAERTDLVTLFDYMEVDEGRKP